MDEAEVVAGQTSDTKVWRVTSAGRIGGAALGTCWLALVFGLTVGGSVTSGAIALFWITLAIVIVGIWRWAFVPYIALTPDGVIVQNRLTKRSVPYAAIAEVESGFYGLRLVTKDHDVVTAWAVQKSNASKWTHRSTRADEVAAAITTRVSPL